MHSDNWTRCKKFPSLYEIEFYTVQLRVHISLESKNYSTHNTSSSAIVFKTVGSQTQQGPNTEVTTCSWYAEREVFSIYIIKLMVHYLFLCDLWTFECIFNLFSSFSAHHLRTITCPYFFEVLSWNCFLVAVKSGDVAIPLWVALVREGLPLSGVQLRLEVAAIFCVCTEPINKIPIAAKYSGGDG
jgi:hypothetical protein